MNDQPENASSDQPTPRSTERANRSRRARIYGALQRAWASIVGDSATEAAPKQQSAANDSIRPGQNPPDTRAQPGDAAPATNEDRGVKDVAPIEAHSIEGTPAAPGDTATESQPAAKAPGAAEQPAAATSAASAGASADMFGRIEEAARDLMFMSETDVPVEPFAWSADTPFTPEALRATARIAADEPLTTEDIDRFFRNPTTPRDWHEDAEKEQVRRFTALRDLLKAELSDIKVYRFGSTAIEVYVVGRAADGSMLGIHTNVVET